MPLYRWDDVTEELHRDDTQPTPSLTGTEEVGKFKVIKKEDIGLKARDVVYIPKGSQAAFEKWSQTRAGELKKPVAPPPAVASDWKLTQAEWLVGLACGRAQTDECAIAFIWDPTTKTVRGVGKHTGAASGTWQTAIVNALQNTPNVEGCVCVSSYAPSEMCKGMANVLKVGLLWAEKAPNSASLVVKKDSAHDFLAFTLATVVPSDKVDPLANPKDFHAKMSALQALAKLTGDASNTVKTLAEAALFTQRLHPQESVLKAFSSAPATVASHGPSEDHFYLYLALTLVGMTWSPKSRGELGKKSGSVACGNNVAALLVHDQKIIGWGLNVMTQHATLHAETAAIQAYFHATGKSRLPKGCRIYSSLQPCKMCAGFIAHVGDDTRVIYALQDQDLKTVLSDKKGLNGCTAQLYAGEWIRDQVKNLRAAVGQALQGINGGTTKAMFDKDVDHEYEWAKRQRPDFLSAQEAQELTVLKGIASEQLKQHQRRSLAALLRRQEFANKVQGKRDAMGALGARFAGFADPLFDVVAQNGLPEQQRTKPPQAIALANQCLDLLTVAASTGMSTRYGVGIVEKLFARLG